MNSSKRTGSTWAPFPGTTSCLAVRFHMAGFRGASLKWRLVSPTAVSRHRPGNEREIAKHLCLPYSLQQHVLYCKVMDFLPASQGTTALAESSAEWGGSRPLGPPAALCPQSCAHHYSNCRILYQRAACFDEGHDRDFPVRQQGDGAGGSRKSELSTCGSQRICGKQSLRQMTLTGRLL